MPRLIDADALINDVTERYCKNCERRKGIKNGKQKVIYDIGDAPCRACPVDDMKDELENAPPVDAEPVRHGHWIEGNNFHWYSNSCSCCGYTRTTDIKSNGWNQWKYCPMCGAKMDGERREDAQHQKER